MSFLFLFWEPPELASPADYSRDTLYLLVFFEGLRVCGDADVYFLPQRPYCTVGSLKDQLLYPSLEEVDTKDYYY